MKRLFSILFVLMLVAACKVEKESPFSDELMVAVVKDLRFAHASLDLIKEQNLKDSLLNEMELDIRKYHKLSELDYLEIKEFLSENLMEFERISEIAKTDLKKQLDAVE